MVGQEREKETNRGLTDREVGLLQEAHPPLELSPKSKEKIFRRLQQMFNSIYKQEETKK